MITSWQRTRSVEVRFDDDLRTIAYRELGDASRWTELVVLNGLVPPYISKEGGNRVLKPGTLSGFRRKTSFWLRSILFCPISACKTATWLFLPARCKRLAASKTLCSRSGDACLSHGVSCRSIRNMDPFCRK